MIWYYLISDIYQAFGMTELHCLARKSSSNKKFGVNSSQLAVRGDVAFGFESGLVKIYDLSEHF